MSHSTLGIQQTPAVTVVVPVLNEEKDIGNLLQALLGQDEPTGGFELLVVDGGSTDRTRAIVAARAARDARVTLLDNPGVRSSAGRNVGAHAARGAFILFLDGHCRLPRQDYLVRLVEIFRSTKAACLCRPQPLQDLAESAWARAIAASRHSWLGHNPGSDIYGGEPAFTDPRSAGAAYERAVFDAVGGYDERFDACEDVEFNHRVALAGLKAYRHPDLTIHYRPRHTLGGLFRQMWRYGRGRARLWSRYPRLVPWPLVGVSLVPILCLALGLLLGWSPVLRVVALLGGMWILAVLVESLRLGGPSKQAGRIAGVYPVLYAGLFGGFWRGMLEYRRFRAPAGKLARGANGVDHALGPTTGDARSVTATVLNRSKP